MTELTVVDRILNKIENNITLSETEVMQLERETYTSRCENTPKKEGLSAYTLLGYSWAKELSECRLVYARSHRDAKQKNIDLLRQTSLLLIFDGHLPANITFTPDPPTE
jgi:hypothetical protein